MRQANLFSPFRSRAEDHEDRLTWGLLMALRYAPALQSFFRDLVLQHVPRDRWPRRGDWVPAAIFTQTGRLGPETELIISVLLSDDSLPEPMKVQRSDRTARYDGVIEYSDGLVLIVENKPRSVDVWKGQLSPSRASLDGLSEDVDLFPSVVSLEWAHVLEGVLNYADSPLASYPEKTVAEDFLTFTEELHPTLSPYRTFELCGNRREALRKRIEALLHSIARGIEYEVGVRPGAQPYLHLPNDVVRQVHMSAHDQPDGNGISLRVSIWPGDTTAQARAFLDQVDERRFLDLPAQGWQVTANLHFSHVQKHLVWAETELSVLEYLTFFRVNRDLIGRTSFDNIELEDLISRLAGHGLISSSNALALREEFGETRRGFLNLIPGFRLTRDWPLSVIMELEADHDLETELVEALKIPLSTWGESLPDWIRSESSGI